MKTMSNEIFNKLISKLDNSNSQSDHLVLEAKLGVYEIGFFASEEDQFQVQVDDFGRLHNGKWQQMQPTNQQLKVMEGLFNKELETQRELDQAYERENQTSNTFTSVDYYEMYGVSEASFVS